MNRRFQWLSHMINKHGFQKGIEIGTGRGKTAHHLLEHCPHLKLIIIDPFDHKEKEYSGNKSLYKFSYKDWDHKKHKDVFYGKIKQFIRENRVRIFEYFSDNNYLLEKFENDKFDFVFIDGDHSYEGCKKDILNWGSKIKEKGLLCGHDIDIFEVKKAVKELVPNYEKTVNNVWYKPIQED